MAPTIVLIVVSLSLPRFTILSPIIRILCFFQTCIPLYHDMVWYVAISKQCYNDNDVTQHWVVSFGF